MEITVHGLEGKAYLPKELREALSINERAEFSAFVVSKNSVLLVRKETVTAKILQDFKEANDELKMIDDELMGREPKVMAKIPANQKGKIWKKQIVEKVYPIVDF